MNLTLLLLPLIASPLVYFEGRLEWLSRRKVEIARWAALAVLLGLWALFVSTVQAAPTTGAQTAQVGEIPLSLDGLGLLLTGLALTLGTLATLFSGPYLAAEQGGEKFYALILIMVGSMIGLGCAADVFNLWIWFEMMSVSAYMLVAFYRENPASLEAGVKFLVQSAVGSALILFGIALVLMETGSVSADAIRQTVPPDAVRPLGLTLAGVLFIVGFGVKAALVPLHTWLPDAHSQAPSGVSAMLSGVVIAAGLVAMLRELSALPGDPAPWGALLMLCGAVNMTFGNLLALRQRQIKRMLACSSIAHMGYILLGVGLALYAGVSAQGGMFHMLSHGLMKGLAFLSAGAFLYALTIANGRHAPLTIYDLAGGASRYPIMAVGLTIAVLGLGGLPPLVGFMSKWQIFTAGFATHDGLIVALVILMALNSVLSLAYYAPIVSLLYRREVSGLMWRGKPIPLSLSVSVVALTAAVIVFGLWPHLLDWLTSPAAAALRAVFGGGQ